MDSELINTAHHELVENIHLLEETCHKFRVGYETIDRSKLRELIFVDSSRLTWDIRGPEQIDIVYNCIDEEYVIMISLRAVVDADPFITCTTMNVTSGVVETIFHCIAYGVFGLKTNCPPIRKDDVDEIIQHRRECTSHSFQFLSFPSIIEPNLIGWMVTDIHPLTELRFVEVLASDDEWPVFVFSDTKDHNHRLWNWLA
jgi:hypothetical protein